MQLGGFYTVAFGSLCFKSLCWTKLTRCWLPRSYWEDRCEISTIKIIKKWICVFPNNIRLRDKNLHQVTSFSFPSKVKTWKLYNWEHYWVFLRAYTAGNLLSHQRMQNAAKKQGILSWSFMSPLLVKRISTQLSYTILFSSLFLLHYPTHADSSPWHITKIMLTDKYIDR